MLLELFSRHRQLTVWTLANVLAAVQVVQLVTHLGHLLATVVTGYVGVLAAHSHERALFIILSLLLNQLASLAWTLTHLLTQFDVVFLKLFDLGQSLS